MKRGKVQYKYWLLPSLIIIALLSFTHIPKSLADEILGILPLTTSTEAPTPVPTDSSNSIVPTPQTTDVPNVEPTSIATIESATPSPSETPAAPSLNQQMNIHVPEKVSIDPRAHVLFLPNIQIQSQGNLMICANISSAYFDTGNKGTDDSNENISGDLTNHLVLSGSGSQSLVNFNSFGGLKLTSTLGGLGNKEIQLKFISLTKPSTDASLCNTGAMSNTRILQISPLGLSMDIPKGNVRLK